MTEVSANANGDLSIEASCEGSNDERYDVMVCVRGGENIEAVCECLHAKKMSGSMKGKCKHSCAVLLVREYMEVNGEKEVSRNVGGGDGDERRFARRDGTAANNTASANANGVTNKRAVRKLPKSIVKCIEDANTDNESGGRKRRVSIESEKVVLETTNAKTKADEAQQRQEKKGNLKLYNINEEEEEEKRRLQLKKTAKTKQNNKKTKRDDNDGDFVGWNSRGKPFGTQQKEKSKKSKKKNDSNSDDEYESIEPPQNVLHDTTSQYHNVNNNDDDDVDSDEEGNFEVRGIDSVAQREAKKKKVLEAALEMSIETLREACKRQIEKADAEMSLELARKQEHEEIVRQQKHNNNNNNNNNNEAIVIDGDDDDEVIPNTQAAAPAIKNPPTPQRPIVNSIEGALNLFDMTQQQYKKPAQVAASTTITKAGSTKSNIDFSKTRGDFGSSQQQQQQQHYSQQQPIQKKTTMAIINTQIDALRFLCADAPRIKNQPSQSPDKGDASDEGNENKDINNFHNFQYDVRLDKSVINGKKNIVSFASACQASDSDSD